MSILSWNSFGSGVCIIVVDHDPSAVATDLMKGCIIVRQSDHAWFQKLDNGSTTNIVRLFYKNNYTATSNPGVSNDITEGYEAGSQWLNTSTNTFFKCAKNSNGAAVWV